MPFRIRINFHNLPSSSSSDSGASDNSGGGSEHLNTPNVRNPQEPPTSPTSTETTNSGTSPTPNETTNSGGSESEGSEGEPPLKRRRVSSDQIGFPGETDSEQSTGEEEDEDSRSIISISIEEGAEPPIIINTLGIKIN